MVTRADPPSRETSRCLQLAVPCGQPLPTGPLEPHPQHRLPPEQAGLDLSPNHWGRPPGHHQRWCRHPAQGPQPTL